MNKKIMFPFILLSLITLIAFFLRVYKLTEIPPGINRDEAAIGYNAYSLLLTGSDEYGIKYPLSFKSFGDWKVPLYFYLEMPFIKLFGLSEFATRLPSSLIGTLTVVVTYFLMKELMSGEENTLIPKNTFSNYVSLTSAFLVSISPWHIFMSRNASESNVAVFLVTFGILLFIKSFKNQPLIIVSFLFLALSMYTYHGNHLFTPLITIVLCIYFIRTLGFTKWFFTGLIVFLLLVITIFSKTLVIADITKISGLFILNDTSKIHEFIELRRQAYEKPHFFVKLIHNKPVFFVRTTISNYLKFFSPEFLFIQGGNNYQHNIPDFGNLYMWEAVILPLSLFILFKSKNKYNFFILFWLLVAPLPSAITRDAPHTNRAMVFLPLPALLTAYGLITLLDWFKRYKLKLIYSAVIGGAILLNLIIFIDQYYFYFPRIAADKWGYPFKLMVNKVTRLQHNYKEIIISKPEISPYIYFLFYNKVDPKKFQSEVIRYPETIEGFQHVKSFENISYQKISWSDELAIPNRLYIDWVENIPSGATNSALLLTKSVLSEMIKEGVGTTALKPGMVIQSKLIDQINLPDGTPILYLIETLYGEPRYDLVK